MYNDNLAYDLSKYDAAVQGEEDILRSKIKITKPRAAAEGSAPKIVALCVTALLLLAGVVYGKVEQASLHSDAVKLSKQIDALHSENVRLASELEGKTSIKAVEEYAEKILGLKKLENSQIEYVGIENGNVVVLPETEENFFAEIINGVNGFIEYLKG